MKETDTMCEFSHVHEDVVKVVRENMPDEDTLFDLAEVFKIFGDSTRIKILYVLFETARSHQLRILKQAKLVQSRREVNSIFYSLSDKHVWTILNQGMEHITE